VTQTRLPLEREAPNSGKLVGRAAIPAKGTLPVALRPHVTKASPSKIAGASPR
jgi:hypothetical protein